MSLCDHIPSILDVFKVNFEKYMKNIWKYKLLQFVNKGYFEIKIENENILDVMESKGT